MDIDDLIENVIQWHHQRNLIDGSTDEKQISKLGEEFDELRKRNGEISPIIDRLMMERERIIEEFEDNYRVSWAEAHALTYGQSRAATVE